MSSAYPILAALRDVLKVVPGVATCKIGLEANMTPVDYPMVRIVPSRVTEGAVIGRRQADVLVYFGMPVHEFSDGLEAQYETLMAMEQALLAAAFTAGTVGFLYRETILDEDRIDAYKLMAIRAEVFG